MLAHGLARAARSARPAAARLARNYHAPVQDMRFLLYEVFDFESHYAKLNTGPNGNPDAVVCDRETMDMVIDASATLCEEELAPLNAGADVEGCTWVDEHTIKTPSGFKQAYDMWTEAGWQGLSFAEKWGGQGLPMSLSLIQSDMVATANWTWLMFPGLSKGCINTVVAHATPELQEKWLPPLVSGEFTGTMCLTEPQCGSDLGQVTTRAELRDDGSFSISGTKIFISCGDHDLTENVVHCVLARLPGAPKGTKGISLFLVPKRAVGEDGSVGEHNGVNVSRIENKMGCHGSPTCQIEFEKAQGWLIGKENRGLNHMFTFINTSRMGCGVQGVAAAELAFQNSLWYAKERRSMRSLSGVKEPNQEADAIIYQPSVRTLLLLQKAIAEGGRAMLYECAQMADHMTVCAAAGDEAGEKRHDDRLGFLTPILKGFLTEAGKEAADAGIQVYGGHGYIKDNKAEQVFRDVRIAALWEGTTQIQGLDLLGRKIMLGKLKPINEHCSGLYAQCRGLLFDGDAGVRSHAWSLLKHTAQWHLLTYRIAMRAKSNPEWISSTSVDYLMIGGYIQLASHWLKMEVAARTALAKGGGEQADGFYRAKLQTSAFVFERLLPRTASHAAVMMSPVEAVTDMHIDDFSYDHARP